jgi:hypothetical protein
MIDNDRVDKQNGGTEGMVGKLHSLGNVLSEKSSAFGLDDGANWAAILLISLFINHLLMVRPEMNQSAQKAINWLPFID